MIDKSGESVSAYDLRNSKIKTNLQELLDELKYNPRPYDLGFSFKLSDSIKRQCK